MAQADQPPNIPNAFVDRSAVLITLLNPDSLPLFILPALFRSYVKYDGNLRNGSTTSAVPVGYNQFTGRWNQDTHCHYRFSMLDANTASATILGAPFPGGLLNAIDPPTPCPSTPPPSDRYTEGQHDLIQHMLWNTACHESYLEKKWEATRVKKTEDRHPKREEHPPAVPAAAAAAVIPITAGGGHGTAATAPVTAPNLAAPSVPITGPSNIAGPSTVLTLPIVTSSSTGPSTMAVPPPPRAPSLMQEDEPEPVAAVSAAAAAPAAVESIFTDDDLINFSDIEEEVPLAAMKGKGKEVA
ncbi:hypothetical protein V8D89_006093 [Ganoderma adspersum]